MKPVDYKRRPGEHGVDYLARVGFTVIEFETEPDPGVAWQVCAWAPEMKPTEGMIGFGPTPSEALDDLRVDPRVQKHVEQLQRRSGREEGRRN